MYLEHFGLQILPFENVPDPLFFFNRGDYHRIYKRIISSMEAGRGLFVVTGPVGSGKTTLSQKLIFDFSKDIRVLIWMAEPPATTSDLLLFITQELGIQPLTSKNVFVLRDIRKALLKVNAQNKKYLMIMDEAHRVNDEVLNGIRLLNNLEEGSVKLMQTLLLGQTELLDIINRPEMEFFRQRINTLEILEKMDIEKAKEYISHRIRIAGGLPQIFSDTSIEAICIASNGIPRKINSLSNLSLNMAYEKGKKTVDIQDVYEVAKNMGLGREVFYYMLELEQREKKKNIEVPSSPHLHSDEEQRSEEVNEDLLQIIDASQEGSMTGKTDENITRDLFEDSNTLAVDNNSPGKKNESEQILFDVDIKDRAKQKGLKTPLLILSISLVVFILSIFFYSSRSGCPDFLSCLGRLIRMVM